MKRLAAVSAFVLCSAIAPAFADNPSGPYVGGGFGEFNLHIDNLNDVGQAVSSIAHSHDDAWQLFAGYRFLPFVSVEAAYVNLGHPGDNFSATGSSGHYRVHLDGFSPSVIGTLPLGPIELFAKAGYFFYNLDLRANVSSLAGASIESSHSRNDFLYGGGLGVTFFDHLNVRAEYDQLNLKNERDSNALWLIAAWRF
jgi:hypothetical protein